MHIFTKMYSFHFTYLVPLVCEHTASFLYSNVLTSCSPCVPCSPNSIFTLSCRPLLSDRLYFLLSYWSSLCSLNLCTDFLFHTFFWLSGMIPQTTCTDFYFSHIFWSMRWSKKWERSQNSVSWEHRLTQKILVLATRTFFYARLPGI